MFCQRRAGILATLYGHFLEFVFRKMSPNVFYVKSGHKNSLKPWFENDFVSVSVHVLIKTRMFAVRLLQVHKRNANDARQTVMPRHFNKTGMFVHIRISVKLAYR